MTLLKTFKGDAMNNKNNLLIVLIICMYSILTISELIAQDAKVPGGDQKVPLGAEVRNGKLLFSSKDGDFKWWFDSRIQMDGAYYYENKNPMSNGITFRRLTFAMKALLWKDWEAEVDIDFAEQVSTKSQVELRDMWIKYNVPYVNLSFQAGHFKEPLGMERLNSSRLLTFLERSSITNAIALGRRAGIATRYWSDNYQVTGAIMFHETGQRIDKGQRDYAYSTNLRASVAPINQFGHNLHLGLAGSYKLPEVNAELRANTIEISARTETYVSNPKLLHTGDIADVNYYNRYGFEAMYINGPFLIQSEMLGTSIYRWYGRRTVNLKGGYVMAAYVLTGENRYYYVDEGEVGPIEAPKSSWGAVEIAARYTHTNLNANLNTSLDANDAPVRGGLANQYMFGINYYPNTNIKIQFNYSFVNVDENATRKGNLIGGDDHSFIQMRLQASL